MRKNLLLLFFSMMVAGGLSAQFVIINSPADCEGAIEFGQATAWGATLTDSVWTGDLVLVDDGTALPTEGCSALINGADVGGNFALVDRGSCNFSLKALNAQNAGAQAVVIANHTPNAGVIDMGAGDFAATVTVPVVMITYEMGQTIREKIANGMPVNITIGDFRFDNDLSVVRDSAVYPPYGTVPASQMTQAGDYLFTPGAVVVNKGLQESSNITFEATIDYSDGGAPTQVYDEATIVNTLGSDSNTVVLLPAFDPSANGAGKYDFTYTLGGDSTDQADFDNTLTSSFTVTENLYSKARWNEATNTPFQTTGITIQGGGNIEIITPFEFPGGDGWKIDSVMFHVSTDQPTLSGIDVFLYVYNWVDANNDNGVEASEVELVAFGVHEFGNNETVSDTWVTAPIEDLISAEPGYVLPGDGARVFVGTRYEGSNFVFFGFDEGNDLLQYLDKVTSPAGTFSDAQRPYFQTTSFGPAGADFDAVGIFTDFWSSSSTTLILDEVTSSDDLTEDEAKVELFPNPSSDVITVEVALEKINNRSLSYEIVDMMGRVIYHKEMNNVQFDQQRFDVTNLPSGTYELMIKADDGNRNVRFVVE